MVVRVRSPQADEFRHHLTGPGVTVVSLSPGLFEVNGLTAAQIGEAAAKHNWVLHELTPQQVSLEQAFMEMTRDELEFKAAEPGGRMSALAHTRRRFRGRVTQAHVVRSGVDEAQSRSARPAGRCSIAVLLTIALPAIFAAVTASRWSHMRPARAAGRHPLEIALAGVNISQLAIGDPRGARDHGRVLDRDDPRQPHRRPQAAARALGEARRVRSRLFLLMLPSVLVAFAVSQAILRNHHILQISFSANGVTRTVIGGAVYLMLLGVFALALGAIARNTAGGIGIFAAIFFVIPPLLNILPSNWHDAIAKYLPDAAGRDIFSLTHGTT